MKNLTEKDFKEGLSITCEIDGDKIDDAKLHCELGNWFVCHSISKDYDGASCDDKLGYKYSWFVGHLVTNIKPKHRTIDDLEYGDIIINEENEKRRIMGRCGDVCFLSCIDDFEIFNGANSIKWLKDIGFTLVQEQEEEINPEKELFDMVYAWGRAGIITDEKCNSFQDLIKQIKK